MQADTDTPGASAPGERAAVAKALHGRVGRADSVPLNAYRRRPAALRTSDPLTPNVSATTASHGVPLPAAFNHSATMAQLLEPRLDRLRRRQVRRDAVALCATAVAPPIGVRSQCQEAAVDGRARRQFPHVDGDTPSTGRQPFPAR